jgi:hypothetical protein
MFHNHPRIAIPYESHFLTKYYSNLSHYGNLEDGGNLLKLIQEILEEPYIKMWDHSFDLDRIITNTKEKSFKGAIDAIYQDYVKGKGKVRWGDKSDYLDRMHIINEIFPETQFIHIIRDGRDVASSVMKLPWGPNDIIRAAEWWNQHLWLARRVGAVLGKERYIEVHYENLVENPERELKRLCLFLGEEYSSKMLEYHLESKNAIPDGRKDQHYNVNSSPKITRTYAWKREMHPKDVALFNHYAREMLKEVSYETPQIKIGKLRLALYTGRIFLKRYFLSSKI